MYFKYFPSIFSQRVKTEPLCSLLKRVDQLSGGITEAIDNTSEATQKLKVTWAGGTEGGLSRCGCEGSAEEMVGW